MSERMHEPHFNGEAYQPDLDFSRLTNQHDKIKALMLDGKWRTLRDIAIRLNYSEASVSAQLRHLRKPRFGGHHVMKRRRPNVPEKVGIWEYRVDPPGDVPIPF